MQSCFPICLRGTLSKPGHLLRYRRNCRLDGDLISFVFSIKGHKVMMLSAVFL
ncbi:hypothetical protein MtrunA17_Chr1g0175291 [Medicago truncatula]|uniref:Uncharacterized protein n=1 Tax=Medicago truncatula TaxID=3880 RepID=A0A396JPW9_MEDTR|nr:hypothetical protein MtrunA17_Chr1g0175291 [Medicago truncatula]